MFDREKCWGTPYTYGHNYDGWSVERLEAQVQMLQRVRSQKLCSPIPLDYPALLDKASDDLLRAPRYHQGIVLTAPFIQCVWATRTKGKPEGYAPLVGTVVCRG
jgi:hypothetical protein